MVLCVFVSIINTHSFCAYHQQRDGSVMCSAVWAVKHCAVSDPVLSLQTALVSRHHDTYPACSDGPLIWISTFISVILLICFRCVSLFSIPRFLSFLLNLYFVVVFVFHVFPTCLSRHDNNRLTAKGKHAALLISFCLNLLTHTIHSSSPWSHNSSNGTEVCGEVVRLNGRCRTGGCAVAHLNQPQYREHNNQSLSPWTVTCTMFFVVILDRQDGVNKPDTHVNNANY